MPLPDTDRTTDKLGMLLAIEIVALGLPTAFGLKTMLRGDA